mmetsp:Transcript_54166/g.128981  ORF Transcript_54166/g.128981 Transcript_54166/m.128981 type:complete len:319 (+) Transcript_54166:72-1028(+)
MAALVVPELQRQIEAVLVNQAKQSAAQISSLLSQALREQSTKAALASSRATTWQALAPEQNGWLPLSGWTQGFYDPSNASKELEPDGDVQADDPGELPSFAASSIIPGAGGGSGRVDYRAILADAMKMRENFHSIMTEAQEAAKQHVDALPSPRPGTFRREVSTGEDLAAAIMKTATSISMRRRAQGLDGSALAAQQDAQPTENSEGPSATMGMNTSAPCELTPDSRKEETQSPPRPASQVTAPVTTTEKSSAFPAGLGHAERIEHTSRMAERNASLQRTLTELMADLERARIIRETASTSISPPRERRQPLSETIDE